MGGGLRAGGGSLGPITWQVKSRGLRTTILHSSDLPLYNII